MPCALTGFTLACAVASACFALGCSADTQSSERGVSYDAGIPDGVLCGTQTCPVGGECCLEPSGPACIDYGAACPYVSLTCDGPEDCPNEACCVLLSLAGTPTTVSCTAGASGSRTGCGVGQETVCKQSSYCATVSIGVESTCAATDQADGGWSDYVLTCQ